MRTIPGMTVIVPADDIEARACVRAAYEFEGPVYMRFGRLATPVINDHEDYEFKIGRGVVVREGSDVTIIACGLMVAEALEAAEALAADGIEAEVINMHTIKPLDERLVVASAKKTGRVVTAEEHSIIGGLGEAVASVLAEQHPVPMRRVGVRDVYGESGPAVDLLHKYGLDADRHRSCGPGPCCKEGFHGICICQPSDNRVYRPHCARTPYIICPSRPSSSALPMTHLP